MVEARLEPKTVGRIALWSGLLANIPTGWALCDGQGGRPDLRSKFVVGADPAEEPGGTGGSLTKTHSGVTVADHPALSHTDSATPADFEAPTFNAGYPAHPIQTHTVTQPSDHADIRPPYYKVAYIIKL